MYRLRDRAADMSRMTFKKPFYGWVIVFACMLLAGASTGLLSYLNPLFVTPVTEDLGITRTAFMVYQTFSTIATVIMMPLASSIFQKLPMKLVLIVGGIGGAAAHICYSLATDVTMFYLGAAIAGVSTCLFGAIPIAILTTNWFYEKKGIVTGIAFSGVSIASSLMSPVISSVISNFGWRMGFRLIALLIVCITIPVSIFLICVNPKDKGLAPYGQVFDSTKEIEKQGFSRKQIFKTRSFWLFAVSIFLFGLVTSPAQQQLVAYWTESGNSASFAASMYSLVMFTAIFTKIFLGGIYDKASVTKGTLIVGGLAVLSYITLLLFPNGYAVAIPAVLFGVTVSIQVLISTFVANRLFGDKEYAFIYGIITPVLFAGVAVGSPLSASIYDHFGNYTFLWIACAAVYSVALALIVIADKISKKEYRSILQMERK